MAHGSVTLITVSYIKTAYNKNLYLFKIKLV